MKAKDLRERSAEELKELEKSLSKDLFNHKFKNHTNRLDNTAAIRTTRRDLARVKTLLVEQAKGLTPVAAAEPKKAPAAKKTAAKKTTKKGEK